MSFAECLPKFISWITKCIFYLENHKTSLSTGYCTQANFEWSHTRQEAPKNSIDLYNKMFHHLFFSILFLLFAFPLPVKSFPSVMDPLASSLPPNILQLTMSGTFLPASQYTSQFSHHNILASCPSVDDSQQAQSLVLQSVVVPF